MSDPRAEPAAARPSPAGSLPTAALIAWALLIPLAHAPAILVGRGLDLPLALTTGIALAVSLAAVALLATGRRLDRAAERLEGTAPLLLAGACVAWTAISIASAAAALARFEEQAIAALFGQSFWTLLRGAPFANTLESVDGTLVSHFGVHFSPTLLVLAPFYALVPHPLTLLAGQAVALALAPVPLFALLRPRVGGAAALGLALLPFALPIYARSLGGDFHDSCFLPAPLLAAAWAIETRRPRALFAFALLALGVREDAGLVVAALGGYAWLRGRGAAIGAGLVALGVGWLAVVSAFVVPAFGSPGIVSDSKRFFVAAYGHWGQTPGAALRRWLTDPLAVVRWLAAGEQARYLYAFARPMLLLPPFLDPAFLVAIPPLALNVFSRFTFMHSPSEPYSYAPLAFAVLATVALAARLAARAPAERRPATGLAVAVIVLAGALPSTFERAGRPERPALPAAVARRVVTLVPPGAPVYAHVALHAALCNRRQLDHVANTTTLAPDASFRGRYDWFVLWPAADPAGRPLDAAMAESLAADPRFKRWPGTEPLAVFERR